MRNVDENGVSGSRTAGYQYRVAQTLEKDGSDDTHKKEQDSNLKGCFRQ